MAVVDLARGAVQQDVTLRMLLGLLVLQELLPAQLVGLDLTLGPLVAVPSVQSCVICFILLRLLLLLLLVYGRLVALQLRLRRSLVVGRLMVRLVDQCLILLTRLVRFFQLFVALGSYVFLAGRGTRIV